MEKPFTGTSGKKVVRKGAVEQGLGTAVEVFRSNSWIPYQHNMLEISHSKTQNKFKTRPLLCCEFFSGARKGEMEKSFYKHIK